MHPYGEIDPATGRDRLTAAGQELVESLNGWIHKCVNRFIDSASAAELDELRGIAFEYVCSRVARNYIPSRGKPTTFVSFILSRELPRQLVIVRRHPTTRTRGESMGDWEPAAESPGGEWSPREEPWWRDLTDQQREFLTLRFGLSGEGPRTLKSIGQRYGLSRERVRQVVASALEVARGRLAASLK